MSGPPPPERSDLPDVHVPSGGPGRGPVARLKYWRRIFSAYYGGGKSHLTFWHGTPEVNLDAEPGTLDQYWQRFHVKADYPGQYDGDGIPMLDYRGHVGLQYNPIAIAQYGLGNWNLWRATDDPDRRTRFLGVADWLVRNLEPNPAGLPVWNHHFDWEYRTPLSDPWYSCLSQGQGLSVLARAHDHTGEQRYLDALHAGFEVFTVPLHKGGVSYWDEDGYVWFEETVCDPPTHILNGFMWASWAMYDLALHPGIPEAQELWEGAVRTLKDTMHRFDIGYWSIYDEAGLGISNAASAFYHALHIVQLRIMHRLSGDDAFQEWADRWARYQADPLKQRRAWAHKSLFKLLYY